MAEAPSADGRAAPGPAAAHRGCDSGRLVWVRDDVASIVQWAPTTGNPGAIMAAERAPAERFSLSIVGGFELSRAGRPLVLPPSVERVVAYVALHDGPATRSHIAGTLWLDAPEERA